MAVASSRLAILRVNCGWKPQPLSRADGPGNCVHPRSQRLFVTWSSTILFGFNSSAIRLPAPPLDEASTMNRRLDVIVCLLSIVGLPAIAPAETAQNQLTDSESRSGWQLLFDGKSADGWRNYNKDGISDGWQVVDGAIWFAVGQGAGDIVTDEEVRTVRVVAGVQDQQGWQQRRHVPCARRQRPAMAHRTRNPSPGQCGWT